MSVRAEVMPDGSSIKTKDIDHPLTTKDTWCRPVDIQVGPDGAIYVVDLYEQRIDHASHYQGRIDRERGRGVAYLGKGAKGLAPFDLTQKSTAELLELLNHPNKWFRETALVVLADRREPQLGSQLTAQLKQLTGTKALNTLWAAYQLGALDEAATLAALDHTETDVRRWMVELACDNGQVTSEVAKKLERVARDEPQVEVRTQLAASARRLPAADALPIVRQLLTHDADAQDVFVPNLLWWAIESKAGSDRDRVVGLLAERELWQRPLVSGHLLERTMRRFAASGSRQDLLACAKLLEQSPDAGPAELLLKGFEKAYEGRSLTGLPEELIAALGKVVAVRSPCDCGRMTRPRLPKRSRPSPIRKARRASGCNISRFSARLAKSRSLPNC